MRLRRRLGRRNKPGERMLKAYRKGGSGLDGKWDWERFFLPPLTERQGTKVFKGMAGAGIVVMVMALGGLGLGGFRARLCGFLAGAALAAGSWGTLALAYREWPEEDRFALKIAVRAAFALTAPLFVLIELPFLLESVGVWGCVALSALTAVPFTLSLIYTAIKKK